MLRPGRAVAALALALLLLLSGPAQAARRKAASRKKTQTPTATPTPRPFQGPPAPTPVPLRRAAGACLQYEPGRFVIVAEVGAAGHVFKVDAETKLMVTPVKGARVRVLYVDGPDGPIARTVMAGPVEVPTPVR